jgi:hypothetical protein
MNYFNLSSSTAFLYSLYKYLCCREKVEGDLYEEGVYEGGLYDGGDYEEGVYEEKIYPKLNCNSITPTNTPRDTNLHSRYQSKKFTFNL